MVNKYDELSVEIAKLARIQDDPEIRDAFAYVAEFIHNEYSEHGDSCADVFLAYSDKRTWVSFILGRKMRRIESRRDA
jgi:hypothetical protein